MKRRLVASLACRNNGSRLYGKPLQRILENVTILDQIITALKTFPVIDEIVLGVSEGIDNAVFVDIAHAHNISYIYGDPTDVLMRLIQCGRSGKATDVFRITTECPWFAYDLLNIVWEKHIKQSNDITVCDRLPEGLHFEIYTLDALEKSHQRGTSKDRSEFCSNYPRMNPKEFKIDVILPPEKFQRMDLRVTVDYPEDLILCREIAKAHLDYMPLISVEQIISFLDSRPDLKDLTKSFVVPKPLWDVL